MIAKRLYPAELLEIENKRLRYIELDTELSELVEAAKVEDSDEFNALYDTLKKKMTTEKPQDSFETKIVKDELKNSEKVKMNITC